LGPLLRLPFGLAFFLRVRRVNRPEERKQGGDTDNSNQLHPKSSSITFAFSLHADDQSALAFQVLGRTARAGAESAAGMQV
jgi:hypothetical protein